MFCTMRLFWFVLSSVIFTVFAGRIKMHLNSQQKWEDDERLDIIEDDIIPESLSRNAVSDPAMVWPNGKVYYRIDKGFDAEEIGYISKAMQKIASVSCVQFLPAPKNSTNCLVLRPAPRKCSANVGYGQGFRYVNLFRGKSRSWMGMMNLPILSDAGCTTVANILHELMHALGFHHQHSVPNRDKYVKVFRENIEGEAWGNFEIRNHSQDFGLPYDYASIMHYSLDAYSRNGRLTMEPLMNPGDITIGLKDRLSNLDVLKLNKLYKCCV